MMLYADPELCPRCRYPFMGKDICPECGLHLTTPEAVEVWKNLQQVDKSITAAGIASAPVGVRQELVGSPIRINEPGYLVPGASSRHQPLVDTGTLLLGLGALFILVAGGIGSFYVLGPLALPFTTMIAAGLGFYSHKRGLKTSTEALIFITSCLFSISWVTIFSVSSETATLTWALVNFAALVGFWHVTRRENFKVPLNLAALYMIPASVSGGSWLNTMVDGNQETFWTMAASLGASGLLAAVLMKVGAKKILPLLITAFWALLTAAAAVEIAISARTFKGLYLELNFVPLFLVASGLIALTFLVTPPAAEIISGKALWTVVSLAGILGLLLLVWLPLASYSVKASTVFALAFALAAASFDRDSWRELSLRLASLVSLAIGGLFWTGLWVPSFVDILERFNNGVSYGLASRIASPHPDWWLFLAAGAIIGGFLWLALRWPEAKRLNLEDDEILASYGFLHIPVLIALVYPTTATVSLGFVVAALGIFFTLGRLTAVGLFTLAVAPIFLMDHPLAQGIALLAASAAGLAAYLLIKAGHGHIRRTLAFLTVAYFLVGVFDILRYLEWNDKNLALAEAILASALILGFHFLPGSKDIRNEPDFAATGALLFSALASIGSVPQPWSALLLLIGGSSLVVRGMLSPDRKIFRWLGSGLLGLSWILRLQASDVSTPEAYTAPFAAVLLAVGAWTLWKNSKIGSWQAIAAGVTLALIPSLPWILIDPVSLRAFLVGAIAVAILLAGIYFKLQAPVVIASGFLAFLALIELGPYALQLHPWLIVGTAGGLLFFLGVTFEKRVNDGKAVAHYIGNLR